MQPLDLRRLLDKHAIRPKKRLGQNFLVDEGALEKVADAAELGPADTVLEIGPGLGSLTRHLAARARRVVAVELDPAFLPALEDTLRSFDNVELIQADILRLDLGRVAALQSGYQVVANIPYYITSAIVRLLFEAPVRPARIVLTVQREVAERITAAPGDLSLLAVSVQFYAIPRLMGRISPGSFYPRPEVDSAILRLEVRPQPAVPVADINRFFQVVKAGFSQKRKQLRNALAGGLRLTAAQADALLEQAGVAGQRRAETLTLPEWAALTNALQPETPTA
jgi:16S rRNA (adenine1518-N6/adenine1519-N6)-dimethyltransferase